MASPVTVHGLPATVPDTRLLRVSILRAANLAKKDIFGASDPYVLLRLFKVFTRTGGSGCIGVLRTETKKKTLDPVWNAEFVLRVDPTKNVLLLEVFDSNRVVGNQQSDLYF
jgi:Ca2+-dependent lipid-binding protein